MNIRISQKAESRQRIVQAAARRLRENGIAGMGVAEVMADAGLTHGGFYAHFPSKEALFEAAFREAEGSRDAWLAGLDALPVGERMGALLKRYLNTRHRDHPDDGCPLPAVGSDFFHAQPALQTVLADELENSFSAIAHLLAPDDERGSASAARADAIAALSLCVGGLLLARAVGDTDLSVEIMEAARQAGKRALGGKKPSAKQASGKVAGTGARRRKETRQP